MNVDNLCMGCLTDKGDAQVCPECKWKENTQPESPLQLPPRTVLNGNFVVGRVLGQGGFGITYLGWDMELERKVAIKEYFPNNFAARSTDGITVTVFGDKAGKNFRYGLSKFLEEGKTLAKFQEHPGIVSTVTFFKANDTAYLVMDYVDGITFKEYLDREGGRISFDLAFKILMPVMDALRAVHNAGLLHRDISPDNIYITEKGQIKLLDFGSARYATGEKVRTITVQLKEGYTPEEQYKSKGKQGPWTDVYALGATFYRAVTGQVPPQSLDRFDNDDLIPPSEMGVEITPGQESVLLKSLAIRSGDRFQTVKKFQDTLMSTIITPHPGGSQHIICPKCKKKNRIKIDRGIEKAKCGKCGSYLDDSRISEKDGDVKKIKKDKSKSTIIFGIGITILIALILFFGFNALREAEYKKYFNFARQDFQDGNFEFIREHIEKAKKVKETDQLKELEDKYNQYKKHVDHAREDFQDGDVISMLEHIKQARQVKETGELKELANKIPRHVQNIIGKAKKIGKCSGGLWEAVFDHDIEMVFIPPGDFIMGSLSDETGREADEGPQHKVKITNGFWLGKYEVTIGQYLAFCLEKGTNYPEWLEPGYKKKEEEGYGDYNKRFVSEDPDDMRPIVGISWNDATAYCDWLSAKTGLSFRLPSESEWEYACRARTTTLFYYGNSLSPSQANFDGSGPNGGGSSDKYRSKTLPIGSFNPNGWGIYDMHGNVFEWCDDTYKLDIYKNPDIYTYNSSGNPVFTGKGSTKSVRGGSWPNRDEACRSANRYMYPETHRSNSLGFRLAMTE